MDKELDQAFRTAHIYLKTSTEEYKKILGESRTKEIDDMFGNLFEMLNQNERSYLLSVISATTISVLGSTVGGAEEQPS